MQISGQQATEIKEVYETFLNTLLNADVEAYLLFLEPDFRLIGTTEEEVFFSRDEAVDFLKKTGEQLAGNLERRNGKLFVEEIDEMILITDQFDAYVSVEGEWIFYAKTRVTSWMRHQSEGWKMIQQHFSFPDAKAAEGETVGLEKISQENLQLREAVKRRTIELEQKNLELVIEAALDRVRVVAISMNRKEDLLEIGKSLFNELKGLGFISIRNVMINVFNDKHDFFMDYDYSDYNNGVITKINYHVHPLVEHYLSEIKKSNDAFSEMTIAGDDLESWKINRRERGEPDDLRLETISTLYYYMYSTGTAAIGLSSYSLISNENKELLKRFRNVFDFTYKRFTDVSAALAQAREAQIEAALEKVRSRSLAMFNSGELKEVIAVMFEKLEELRVVHGTVAIQLFDFVTKSSIFWPANHLQEVAPKVNLPYNQQMMDADTCHRDLWNAMEKGEEIFNRVYSKEQKDKWFEYVFANNDLTIIEDQAREFIRNGQTHTVCFLPEKNAALFVDSWDGTRYAEDEFVVLKRVAKVFDQAYTRFLDLQKAEAQAREAQIEAALERVRSRSMGMQKSEELREVVSVLYEQMEPLGLAKYGCELILCNEQTDQMEFWHANPIQSVMPECYYVSRTVDPICEQQWNTWKEGTSGLIIELTGEKKHAFDNVLLTKTDFKKLPDDTKEWINAGDIIVLSFATMKFGFLEAVDIEALPETKLFILNRFAKVFEQTYTRFLDLQKAETQAREAQIEAALEKVRSSSLAMHHSGDLKDIIAVLFEKLIELNVLLGTVAIQLFDQKSKNIYFWVGNTIQTPQLVFMPHDEQMMQEETYLKDGWDAMLRGEDIINREYTVGQKNKYFDYVFAYNDFTQIPESARAVLRQMQNHIICLIVQKNSALFADSWNGQPYSNESLNVIKRAGKVFEQAYIRFLDLQKAEAQARESQIQLALERVRARTMAMQRSDELQDAASLLVQQIKSLGVPQFGSGFNIWDEDRKAATAWMCNVTTDNLPPPFKTSSFEDIFLDIHDAAQRGESLFVREQLGEELEKHYSYMHSIPIFREYVEKSAADGLSIPGFQIMHCAFFSQGYLMFITYEPVPEAHDIFKRFAKVFEQTYTRFLDLQKAEAQAREAQIEAALERVRSRSLAMHRSDELEMVAGSLFDRLVELGLSFDGALIFIFDKEKRHIQLWIATTHLQAPVRIDLPFDVEIQSNTIIKDLWYAIEKREDIYNRSYTGETKNNYFRYVSKYNESKIPASVREIQIAADSWTAYLATEKNSMIGFDSWSGHIIKSEDFQTLKRFARVFEQSYTRFLDLQKAEAQAREAQIEVAVERVRAKALAMHHSDEIAGVARIMRNELGRLNIEGLFAVTIYLEQDDGTVRLWDITIADNIIENGPKSNWDLKVHLEELHPRLFIRRIWGSTEKYFVIKQNEQDFPILIEWVYQFNKEGAEEIERTIKENNIKHTWFAGVQLEHGRMSIELQVLPPIEAESIMSKIGAAFDLAYKRFLDLQKAEAQAREAQIEAALERVRSRSMGMQKSEELSEVSHIINLQLQQLNFKNNMAGFLLDYKSTDDFHICRSDFTGKLLEKTTIPYFDHPIFSSFRQAKEAGLDFHSVCLNFDEKNKWIDHALQIFEGAPDEIKSFLYGAPGYVYSCAMMNNVALYIENFERIPFSKDQNEILKRFGKVFEQSYTRFLDLQRAEAQALEAVKRASVDRVRAEIASMRTTKDLERITPLIWNELSTLGVPFFRCGVFIMDEEKQEVQSYLSTPEGNAIAAFRQPFNTPGEISDMVASWHKKELYRQHWNEDKFIEFTQSLVDQHAITSGEKYLVENRPSDLFLHFVPFLQGMLYVGSTASLTENELQLVQNLADAFSTAYARYEDFNKLEAAKREVDKTLTDLKQTQAKLVQSEKMASLGQLTAGIAHEIQNPLNFVNNFSDVNGELLAELKEEADKGNINEVKLIADDLIANSEKINHHGKRADAIVKNMLQHSRSANGSKELTDINALADEYLRLSYHACLSGRLGLLAKDKTFKVSLITNFDDNIGKINIIAQDIGRVLLNLFNNAFYAVFEKKKTYPDFNPEISVSTNFAGGKMWITVKDNGNGIDREIIDKIFQPFFTTKPTGQGTGLGLSLSYDIIKTHGGEIEVESTNGIGTAFIITLNAND